MKKNITLILFLVLAVFSASAYTNNAIVFDPDDPIYKDMDALYTDASLVRPSTKRPWSEGEVRMMLKRVDVTSLSEYGEKLYRKIEDKVDSGLRWNFGEDLGVSVGFDTTAEMYAHTNGDMFTTEYDWEKTYDERKSFMKLYVEFTSCDNFYTTCDLHFRHNRVDRLDTFTEYSSVSADGRLTSDGYVGSYQLETKDENGKITSSALYYISRSNQFASTFMTNIFFDTTHYSFIWPRRAVFSLGGNNWNFSISRDRLELGNGRFSNLLVDDHTFSDYARLTFFSDYFKYDFVMLFLNSVINPGEQMNEEGRVYLIHTLEFRVLDRVSFTLSENVMYRYRTLDLEYINPSFIYHNLNNRSMFNALAYLDVNVLITKGFEFYGQLAIDQAQAPNEDDSQTSSYGITGGLQYTKNFTEGSLGFYAEYTKTTPMLYRRDQVDFIRNTRYNAINGTAYFVNCFDYVGFTYGSDCRMLELNLKYTSTCNWNAELFCRFVEKGEVNIYTSHNSSGRNSDWANLRGDTPYGDNITYFMVAGIKGNADLEAIFSWPGISFGVELDWVSRFVYTKSTETKSNSGNDLQLTASVTVAL